VTDKDPVGTPIPECVAQDCACAKCRKKEIERRESEAFKTGALLALFGVAAVAAAGGGGKMLRVLGRVLDTGTPPTSLDKSKPKQPKRRRNEKKPPTQ
jgi:hypothetical protein